MLKWELRDKGAVVALFKYKSDAERYRTRCGFAHFTIHEMRT